MKYIISYKNPHKHLVDIEFVVDDIDQDELIVQLPAWRPGRYELGNFAKNIVKWEVLDNNGKPLENLKLTKDSWKIHCNGISEIHIKYSYYAFEMNAGSTYLDASQLYVNPVNCCMYVPERINDSCELVLILPKEMEVASGMQLIEENDLQKTFKLNDFHDLADSPFIASKTLQRGSFIERGVEFNLWFQGECHPDWKKLKSDFLKFAKEQLETMKAFPVEKYHFLFQILPYKTYHGVEHITSTVISLGPGYKLMENSTYEDLLGVSSHELFHVWNVKTIRPIEMQPYDYSKENYSKLGYVAEGVTTYYGDVFLFRSHVFSEEQYFRAFDANLQKHFDNFGRFNLSVAESSFDTWLDGYVQGVPNRKTSIYAEGCLLAFVTDIFIREHSKNQRSLDDVMAYLYAEYAMKGKGYSDSDYKGVVEHFANASFDDIYDNYINAPADYEAILSVAMKYIGFELSKRSPSKFYEHAIGLKVNDNNGLCKVVSVFPDSVADIAGISIEDKIIVVNNVQIENGDSLANFKGWSSYFAVQNEKEEKGPLNFTIVSQGIMKQVIVHPQPNSYYKVMNMVKGIEATAEQKINFEKWSKNKF